MDTKDSKFEITVGVNDALVVLKILTQANISYAVAGYFVPSVTGQVPSPVKNVESTKPTPKLRKAPKAKPAIKDTKIAKTTRSGPSNKSWWTKKRRAEHGAKIQAKKDALNALQAQKLTAKAAK